ncbi:MAG: hypothetical protein ACFB0C_23675 [Leptolyngbyaceae cyanobacterium]
MFNFWQVALVGVIKNASGTRAIYVAATIALFAFIAFAAFDHFWIVEDWTADGFKHHGHSSMMKNNSVLQQTLD